MTVPDEKLASLPAEQEIRDRRQADVAFAGGLLAVLVIAAALYARFPTIMVILLLAGLFAYALLPIVDRLDRKMPRTLAVVVVALALVCVLTGVTVVFAPAVAHELALLPQVSGDVARSVSTLWQRARAALPASVGSLADGLLAAAGQALKAAAPNASTLSTWATAAASGVTAVASAIIFVPVFVFLMLRGFHASLGRLERSVPARWRPQVRKRMHEVDSVLSGFIRGQLLVAAIMAVCYSTAFTLLHIPLGLVIGLLAGLGELAPFLGGIIAVTLGSLMALAGGHPTDVIWVVLTALSLHGLEASVINPWIVGTKAKVGPAVVIVALAIGAELYGVLGLLLAVPVAALLKVGSRAAFDAYRLTPFFRRRAV